MDRIKEKFAQVAAPLAISSKKMLKEHGNVVMGQYTLEQVYSGMKGIIGLITETSLLDSEEGIRFRGYTIPELRERLPKADGGVEPLPEGLFYLMLIGELPTEADVRELSNELARTRNVQNDVFKGLDSCPNTTQPNSQFPWANNAIQTEHECAAD